MSASTKPLRSFTVRPGGNSRDNRSPSKGSLCALMDMVTRGLFEQKLAVGFSLLHENGFGAVGEGEAHMVARYLAAVKVVVLLASYAGVSGLVQDGVVHRSDGGSL